jgi:anti-anti-sigma factor
MSEQLTVRTEEPGEYVVVAADGKIFFDTVEPLRAALTDALATQPPRLVLDMSAVPLCDSTGLNLIAHTHRTAMERSGWLRLVGVQPAVRRVLEITNLIELLSLCATVEDAVRS